MKMIAVNGSPLPEHSCGAQWTVVSSEEGDCIADGKTTTYSKGDSCLIPARAFYAA